VVIGFIWRMEGYQLAMLDPLPGACCKARNSMSLMIQARFGSHLTTSDQVRLAVTASQSPGTRSSGNVDPRPDDGYPAGSEDRQVAEKDVTYNLTVYLGDQRQPGMALGSQGIDQPRFIVVSERHSVDFADGGQVAGTLASDDPFLFRRVRCHEDHSGGS
jgi:hypothetical protein